MACPRRASPPEQQKIQEMETQINWLEREKAILKSYRSLDVGRTRSYALIVQLIDTDGRPCPKMAHCQQNTLPRCRCFIVVANP